MEIAIVCKNAVTNLLQKSYHRSFTPKKKESNWVQMINYYYKNASGPYVESAIGQRTKNSCLDLKLTCQTKGL